MRVIATGTHVLHAASIQGDRVVLELREVARVEQHLNPDADTADVQPGWTPSEDGMTAVGPLYVVTGSLLAHLSFDHAQVMAQEILALCATGRAAANGLPIRPTD